MAHVHKKKNGSFTGEDVADEAGTHYHADNRDDRTSSDPGGPAHTHMDAKGVETGGPLAPTEVALAKALGRKKLN